MTAIRAAEAYGDFAKWFFDELRRRQQTTSATDFCVVTDSFLGECRNGGAQFLRETAKDLPGFLRGAVYSTDPQGIDDFPQNCWLVTASDPNADAKKIRRFLETGEREGERPCTPAEVGLSRAIHSLGNRSSALRIDVELLLVLPEGEERLAALREILDSAIGTPELGLGYLLREIDGQSLRGFAEDLLLCKDPEAQDSLRNQVAELRDKGNLTAQPETINAGEEPFAACEKLAASRQQWQERAQDRLKGFGNLLASVQGLPRPLPAKKSQQTIDGLRGIMDFVDRLDMFLRRVRKAWQATSVER